MALQWKTDGRSTVYQGFSEFVAESDGKSAKDGLRAYGAVIEARGSIGKWLEFYNDKRPHQALGYRTPREIFEGEACEHVNNASASLRCAHALPTCSQAHRQEKEVIMY